MITQDIISDMVKQRLDKKIPDFRAQPVRCPHCGDQFWWMDTTMPIPSTYRVKCQICGKMFTPYVKPLRLEGLQCSECGHHFESDPKQYTSVSSIDAKVLFVIIDCSQCKKSLFIKP